MLRELAARILERRRQARRRMAEVDRFIESRKDPVRRALEKQKNWGRPGDGTWGYKPPRNPDKR